MLVHLCDSNTRHHRPVPRQVFGRSDGKAHWHRAIDQEVYSCFKHRHCQLGTVLALYYRISMRHPSALGVHKRKMRRGWEPLLCRRCWNYHH